MRQSFAYIFFSDFYLFVEENIVERKNRKWYMVENIYGITIFMDFFMKRNVNKKTIIIYLNLCDNIVLLKYFYNRFSIKTKKKT